MSKPAPSVCGRFNRQANRYEERAGLQRAIAWRLAHHAASLPLAEGPRADLGAGSGLVGQALRQITPELSLLQVDGSEALLSRNPLAPGSPQLLWDLNNDLPKSLQGSALLSSSFSLHWLNNPAERLRHWAAALAPGGWLVLAVPVAGSFPQWYQAAERAGVPCTAHSLPEAGSLIAAASSLLRLKRQQTLVFSRRYGPGGRRFLQQLKQLGAGHSDQPPLSPGQWRQLLAHWPAGEQVSWHILVLIAQRSTPC